MRTTGSLGPTTETRELARKATPIAILLSVILAAAALYALINASTEQLWSILPLLLGALTLIWFAGTGNPSLGSLIFAGLVAAHAIVSVGLERGTGIQEAVAGLSLIGVLALVAFPPRLIGRVLLLGLIVAIASVLVDLFGSSTRFAAVAMTARWGYTYTALVLFLLLFIREFFSLDIRTKIVLGILATGGSALGIFGLFAFARAAQITGLISGRLETSVKQLAEEQLVNTAHTQADSANHFFESMASNVTSLAAYRVALQSQINLLGSGSYWDASTRMAQLSGGQFGNAPSDPSSVFVPVNGVLDPALIAELNTSAYLDFIAPGLLKANSSVLAVYYIEPRGSTRYYPNVNLASLIPANFDATSRPYYKITAPLFNPKRLTRWSIPYVDAAGGGLVVTVAAPVYFGDEFHGVVAADVKLATLTAQVSGINIGQTGYAFMIDDAGRIISMPPQGYAMFTKDLRNVAPEDFFKQTVLGASTGEINAITNRMTSGAGGLTIIKINGVDNYISYAPLPATGYNLALVVPVAEMQSALAASQSETQVQVVTAVRLAALIFIGLLFVAVAVSLAIGQFISTPVIRLTQTANQVVAGDLTARADVATRDEVGTLATAFNTMTSRIRETMQGLEQRVAERTDELVRANEQIERRARQFESIARVARAINQTQALQDILPQITRVISDQFGFYHVGIFLLDVNNEYAVLAAANSEGGQRMLVRSHRLRVGQVGIVGNVAGTGTARIALDTGADAVYFNNVDLPETRSEIALPLTRSGDRPIGVLDVQSTVANAFGPEDIQVLSTLAEQVAVAISNARLYEETQRTLAEAELLYRRDLQQGWGKYTRSQKLAGIRRRGMKASLYTDPMELPGAPEVIASGEKYQSPVRPSQVTLPIKLRGEVVGLISLSSDVDRPWTQDQLDIVNAIVERSALSIENSRLLSESQKQAAKERVIGEIASKVSSFTHRENILQAAVVEIGRALPGAEVVIQLEAKDGNG